MSAKASAASLNQATKELLLAWQETRAYWHDIKSSEFEQQYIEELPNHVQRALGVMEEIDTLLRKVRNDCE
ncbi:MAG: hypothetical protein WCO68_01235 [Verrucomicrobiota bacterium]